MKLNNKRIIKIISIVFILICTNTLTYEISKHFTTQWYQKYIRDNALFPYGYYQLRTDHFENVLYINTINDTTILDVDKSRYRDKLPCIAKKHKNKLIFVDISKDYAHRGEKYFSSHNEHFEIKEGDTLWIDAWISETPNIDTDIYLISLSELYLQPTYTSWKKVFFKNLMEDSTKNK